MRIADCRVRSAGARRVLLAAGLVGACGVLFFYRLADRDLWSSHEARAAMDAQTLLEGGAAALPHLFDGRAEVQKPPLYYWLVAGLA
jgi:4-amino-4-deoxy-L-arabinose transferase-like glycosyltransferase